MTTHGLTTPNFTATNSVKDAQTLHKIVKQMLAIFKINLSIPLIAKPTDKTELIDFLLALSLSV